jgi:hypothetical protein
MTPAEIRDFKVALLDDIHGMSTEPVPDIESVKLRVDEFFTKLEAEFGEKEDSGN